MKKCLLITLSAILLAPLAQAKGLPELFSAIERAVAEQVIPFANGRVKQMCQEWPTCEEWVENKVQKNPSFKVVDAEIERWVSKWNGKKAIWNYRFYVQTEENRQTKVYRFSSGEQLTSFAAPVLIKKFPSHPGKPTEHISFYKSVSNRQYYTYYRSLCNSWPGYEHWEKRFSYDVDQAVVSQYIYRYDSQGNALWKKRLYVKEGSIFPTSFYFQAYQTQAGGEFTYQAPVETKYFPVPDF